MPMPKLLKNNEFPKFLNQLAQDLTKFYNLKPPTFGLNFVDNKDLKNQNFMLLCGFEKFDAFFVRIDILERLFMLIINSNSKEKSDIKVVPEKNNIMYK